MSNKPWYYVKGHGNRENMDRLIASKREKEARQIHFKRQNSDYFDRWQRQSEWIDRKGFKKSPLNKSTSHLNVGSADDEKTEKSPASKAPYDLDFVPVGYGPKVNEQSHSKWLTVHKEAKALFEQILAAERGSQKLEDEESLFIRQLENLLLLRRQLKDKQENWTIRESKLFYKRFAKDRLRAKAFLICEQLNHHKMIIQFLSKSANAIYSNEKEKQEILEVIGSSLDIINMYLDVNYKRDYAIVPLYNEEAERKLLDQESVWERERSVWYSLVDRVIEAFFMVYKCKLEDNLDAQETLRETRAHLVDRMINFRDKLKVDHDLSTILSEDLNHLLTGIKF